MRGLIEALNGVGENTWAVVFALLGCGMATVSIWHKEVFPAATALLSMAALAFRGDRSHP
jgi:hypothetical protein